MRILIFTILLGLCSGTAFAQSKETKRAADQHYRHGVELYGEAKYTQAIAEFQRAYELAPHPVVLYNLGIAYRALSNYGAAVDALERFVNDGKGVVAKKELRRGAEELKALRALVATVVIQSTPAGAMIAIDGEPVGVTPLAKPVLLGPGPHSVRATLDGYEETQQRITVASGDQSEVSLELVEKPAAPVPAPVVQVERSAPAEAPSRPWLGITAGFGTNALQIDETGAPVLGLSLQATRRLSLAVDSVLAAYAVLPSARFRLIGETLGVDAMLSVPVSFKDGDESDVFAAIAGGLAIRYRATTHLAVRVDGMVSYAGEKRGVTLPLIAATEYWF